MHLITNLGDRVAPASVTAGGSSTLTLTVGAGATSGTYPLTITGLAVPTFLSSNDATGVPPKVTSSRPTTPTDSVGVPLRVAVLVLS